MTLCRFSRCSFASLLLCACGTSNVEVSTDPPRAAEPPLLAYSCRGTAQKSADPSAFAAALPALRDTGHRLGVALAASRLGDADYAATAARHFNYVTAENEMKWDATEPSAGSFTFAAADKLVTFAQEHQMQVRGHTLVWYSQLPAWVNALTGEDAVRAAMTSHIEGVMSHFESSFPGAVIAWDVVNEALDQPAGSVVLRDNVFFRELGEGYIAEAFEIAHRVDPDALLFYNDYGIEGLSAKANAAFELVKGLVDAGVPIHGVGLQMHTNSDNRGPTYDELKSNIQRYADLGLRVNITEMDVNLCTLSNDEFALEAQRFRYNRIVATCVASEACDSVALWGLFDKASWLNDTASCAQASYAAKPLAFADDYSPKPAFWGIYDALLGCFYD